MSSPNSSITFKIIAQDKNSRARAGIINTKHGNIETPYLIPVATKGEIKSLSPKNIASLKPQALLANTYHLHLKPGDTEIKNRGGLHKFMKFNKPIFTDSGGFQAFSLGIGAEIGIKKIGFFPGERMPSPKGDSHVRITKKGVIFKSIYPPYGKHFVGPKESMQIQSNLGADIIIAFDECTSPSSNKKYIEESMQRSHRWEKESLKYHNPNQALYGIIHGGWFKDLRIKSAKYINSLQFDGIAIGGSLGKTKEDMHTILDWIIPNLDNRPRHMLGIGWIDDLFCCVEQGIDTFDCVEMTRIARHGSLYISPETGGSLENKFRINIQKTIFQKDKKPIDPNCKCSTCKKYSRARIRKLYKTMTQKKEDQKARNFYGKLATTHNIHFMLDLTSQIRESILKGNGAFQKLKNYWLKKRIKI